jgi:hypothetical protein
MTEVKNDSLTITMTDRPPVKISKKVWTLVAQAKDWDGEYECQANRTWKVSVRQCQRNGDDRCIVYGSFYSGWSGEDTISAGVINEAPQTIKDIVEQIKGSDSLAQNCIADLPAEEI